MADRIEREIEEILAKLDNQLPAAVPSAKDRAPVSINSVRKQRQRSERASTRTLINRINPPMLMLTGAGTMILGLVAASLAGPLIWLAFAGVVLFLGAFLISFLRSSTAGAPRGGSSGREQGKFWRDRYITDDRPGGNPAAKIKKRFWR
jgi:hypothetical protein